MWWPQAFKAATGSLGPLYHCGGHEAKFVEPINGKIRADNHLANDLREILVLMTGNVVPSLINMHSPHLVRVRSEWQNRVPSGARFLPFGALQKPLPDRLEIHVFVDG